MSLDVLLFVPDKEKVLREAVRILKPGARFAGTTFELRTTSTAVSAPAFDAYPSAFEAAGFVVEIYEEARDWRRFLERVLQAILTREADSATRFSLLPGHVYTPGRVPDHWNWQIAGAPGFACGGRSPAGATQNFATLLLR